MAWLQSSSPRGVLSIRGGLFRLGWQGLKRERLIVVVHVCRQIHCHGQHDRAVLGLRLHHSDNGPEFTATAVRRWLSRLGVKTLFIEPGSPWENGYIESFNGKLRGELLNREIFYTLISGPGQLHGRILHQSKNNHGQTVNNIYVTPHCNQTYSTLIGG